MRLVLANLMMMVIVCAMAAAAEPQAKMAAPYVFTDAKAVVLLDGAAGEVACKVKVITADGLLPEIAVNAKAENGKLEIAPVAEGIHVVTLGLAKPVEVRFLAIAPPPAVDKAALAKTLPRSGAKLAAGQKYTIVAMGDSVTNTGDFEGMLAMLLARATGNANIVMIDRSYPGRSVDAAVRFFQDDAIPNHPDLGLLMYGLNDQIGGVPLDAYLEQYRWIAEHMAADCGGDTVFMQPTPHIDIPQGEADRKPESNPPQFAFRAIGFAESLRPLAAELKVPLAETFQAVWGKGGSTIEEAAKNMWPKYPPGYNEQMRSMAETGGNGDTIHPNALGHLAMAKAVFDAIADRHEQPPLQVSGRSMFAYDGARSRIFVRNVSGEPREGTIHVFPPIGGELSSKSPVPYKLGPNEEMSFEVTWPQLKGPGDTLLWPLRQYFIVRPSLPVQMVDVSEGGSRMYFSWAGFEESGPRYGRGRWVCPDAFIDVELYANRERSFRRVTFPQESEVGRMLVAFADRDAAEMAYVRFGGALAGEAAVDGDLAEWGDAVWSTVGEKCQARWVQGEVDNRATLRECYMKWAFRAGKAGVYFAVKATGQLQKDRFTLFLDTREPKLLGTAGRYYWAGGSLAENGTVPLGAGETTKKADGMKGAWKKTDDGSTIELFVPYALMELAAWPASRDLGLSIWWVHTGPDGKVTNVMWSEDGHPWNPRWYGVVRLVKDKAEKLPYVVRVR